MKHCALFTHKMDACVKLAVSITYISNLLLIDASLSTYESNHKTRYAVSALIM